MQNNEVIRRTGFSTISRKQVHMQPVGSSVVEVYDFVNTFEPGPSGTKEDYRVLKKPKFIEKYDIKKVMKERCKGCDLKSIVARIEQTGDASLLMQRPTSYGDARLIPANRSDALQKGVESAAFLDKLSAKEKEELIAMAKDSKKFDEFISSHQKKSDGVIQKEEVIEKKGDDVNG